LGSDTVQQLASGETLEALMQHADRNGDGVMDFKEFMEVMKER